MRLATCELISVCFIGNLWSVTDKDSDKITTEIVKKLDEVAKGGDMKYMTRAVSMARK